jgi:hypothetical protein
MSYEMILYQYALSMLQGTIKELKVCKNNAKSYIYFLKPQSLVTFFDGNQYENDAGIQKQTFSKVYKCIYNKYIQYKQNKALKELNIGIDLKRFDSDNIYKTDTIIGLCMDIETFELACSLARFYSFDIWKVYMAFTEFLLTEYAGEELNSSIELENRLNQLMQTLRSRNNDFLEYMNFKILPLLDGKGLDKLIVFYNLLGKLTLTFFIGNFFD